MYHFYPKLPSHASLAGQFLTTGPTGKSLFLFLIFQAGNIFTYSLKRKQKRMQWKGSFGPLLSLISALNFPFIWVNIADLIHFLSEFSSVEFSNSVKPDSLWPHGLQHTWVSCSSPTPGACSTHVHWVGDAIQPLHLLSSPSLSAFNLSQNQGPFQWVSYLHQVAKVLELQLQHQSFQWIFRVDFI